MAWAFITSTQLSRRLGPAAMRRVYDDLGGGEADANAISQLIADASGKVASYLQGIVSLSTAATAATGDTAHEIVRLTLDVAVAMAAQRHPEVLPSYDGLELMKQAERDLDRLRKNQTALDTDAAPNPAANEGGDIFPDPHTEDVYTFARDGFGDF
jgi:hypothetical protein